MPVTAADLPAIERALHTGEASVQLADAEELTVTVCRPRANEGKGSRSVKGVAAAGGVQLQFNAHDCSKKSKWTELAKEGKRVTWILAGKFPKRAAVPMVDGKVTQDVPALPGAEVQPDGTAGSTCTLAEALVVHEALHSDAAEVEVGGEKLKIFGDKERRCLFRGVPFRQQAANKTAGGKVVAQTGCKLTWIEVKGGGWGKIIDGELKTTCSFIAAAAAAEAAPPEAGGASSSSSSSGAPPVAVAVAVAEAVPVAEVEEAGAGVKAEAEAEDDVGPVKAEAVAEAEAAVEEPPAKKAKKEEGKLPPVDLSKASAKRSALDRDTEEFWKLEELFAAHVHGRNEDYNEKRIKNGDRPISFVLAGAETVDNPILAAAFEARKAVISEERGPAGARERHAFHGTHPSHVGTLCDRGLLPFGHELNPSKAPVDSGYFGSCKKGVYVSRYADYTLKYANRLVPLKPGERCKIVLFRCLPGHSKHIAKLCGPVDPTAGYDSHSSPQFLEWYLFHPDQLCPSHVLTVEAREDTRTASDDQ